MKIITDDKGRNQIFSGTKAASIRLRRRSDYILAQMIEETGRNILEIGSGTGEASLYLAEKTSMNVLGIDICEPNIEGSKEKDSFSNLPFRALDFTKFSQNEDRKDFGFDYIVGNGILHHLYPELSGSLSAIKSLLNQGRKSCFRTPIC